MTIFFSQWAYDNAEEPIDKRRDAIDHITDLFCEGDASTALAFAEYAYDRMSHAEIIDAMAALFMVSESKWLTLLTRLDDVVGEPLNCLRIVMEEYRANFIEARADQILEDK